MAPRSPGCSLVPPACLFSSSGLLPAVLVQFPGPGWGGSRPLSHISTAGIYKLGWALGSCPVTPGNAPLPYCLYCCCCLADHLGVSGIKQQCLFIVLLPSCVVWEPSSVRQFSLGVSCGCRWSQVEPSPGFPPYHVHVCWLLLAVGFDLSGGP